MYYHISTIISKGRTHQVRYVTKYHVWEPEKPDTPANSGVSLTDDFHGRVSVPEEHVGRIVALIMKQEEVVSLTVQAATI